MVRQNKTFEVKMSAVITVTTAEIIKNISEYICFFWYISISMLWPGCWMHVWNPILCALCTHHLLSQLFLTLGVQWEGQGGSRLGDHWSGQKYGMVTLCYSKPIGQGSFSLSEQRPKGSDLWEPQSRGKKWHATNAPWASSQNLSKLPICFNKPAMNRKAFPSHLKEL